MSSDRHIFLSGFMGTGKSTVGLMLASRLALPFVDLDDLIVSEQDKTIADIFRDEGEEAFRQHELSALKTLLKGSVSVVALGGGAVTADGIAQLLRASGRTVLLTADWDALWERLKHDTQRPLLIPLFGDRRVPSMVDKETFIDRAEPILQSRRDAYYETADFIVDTSGLTATVIVERIAAWINGEE